jgi:hypothetical protein
MKYKALYMRTSNRHKWVLQFCSTTLEHFDHFSKWYTVTYPNNQFAYLESDDIKSFEDNLPQNADIIPFSKYSKLREIVIENDFNLPITIKLGIGDPIPYAWLNYMRYDYAVQRGSNEIIVNLSRITY